MSDSQTTSDNESSQTSGRCTSAVIPLVSYKLEGYFNIESPVYLKDIPEVNRRSAVIISCHLFHEATDPCWKGFRSHIASNLYKRMSTYGPAVDRQNFLASITSWRLLLNSKCYIVDDEQANNWTADELFSQKVVGSLEMVVANQFIVIVSYNVKIKCDTSRLVENLDGYKMVAEPHYTWEEHVEDVDKAHGEKFRKFSCAIANRSISMGITCSPFTYVSQI